MSKKAFFTGRRVNMSTSEKVQEKLRVNVVQDINTDFESNREAAIRWEASVMDLYSLYSEDLTKSAKFSVNLLGPGCDVYQLISVSTVLTPGERILLQTLVRMAANFGKDQVSMSNAGYGRMLGISASSVQRRLASLEEKGLIERKVRKNIHKWVTSKQLPNQIQFKELTEDNLRPGVSVDHIITADALRATQKDRKWMSYCWSSAGPHVMINALDGLSDLEKLVTQRVYLDCFLNDSRSQSEISEQLGCTVRSVRTAVAKLSSAGLVSVVRARRKVAHIEVHDPRAHSLLKLGYDLNKLPHRMAASFLVFHILHGDVSERLSTVAPGVRRMVAHMIKGQRISATKIASQRIADDLSDEVDLATMIHTFIEANAQRNDTQKQEAAFDCGVLDYL